MDKEILGQLLHLKKHTEKIEEYFDELTNTISIDTEDEEQMGITEYLLTRVDDEIEITKECIEKLVEDYRGK